MSRVQRDRTVVGGTHISAVRIFLPEEGIPVMKPHRGVMILVFGILGLVLCPLFAIAAWVMGNGDMAEIQAGRMDPEGQQLTNIGRILGMVGTCLLALWLVFACIWVLLLGGLAAAGG
jgi:hypothetical protein